MAKSKRSKYDELVNEAFEILHGEKVYKVDVIDCKMVEKVSKTGRKYKVRRLWVALSGSAIELEISTQSWNKKSFMKKLVQMADKASNKANVGTVKSGVRSTIRTVRGVVFGSVQDLIEWGDSIGMYRVYKQKYSYKTYKQKIEDAYHESLKATSSEELFAKFHSLKSEIKRFERDLQGINSMVSKDLLDLSLFNLERLLRGELYDNWGDELLDKLECLLNKAQIDYFNRMIGSVSYKMVQSKYGFDKCKDEREVKRLYRKLSKEFHPDLGGDQAKFIEMKKEYDKALQCINTPISTYTAYAYQPVRETYTWERPQRPKRETSRRF